MKLTNHRKDNSYTIDTYVMHGTIEMSRPEYQKVYLYLWGQYQKAIKDIETYKRDGLSSLGCTREKNLFSFGVVATKLIVKRFGLTGYKDQNYGIKIVY